MAQQTIAIGTTANDGTGDPLRTAGGKINANFTELYTTSGVTPLFRTPTNSGFTVDRNGTADSTSGLNSFFASLATSGDPGMIEAGTYRTTAELVLPAGAMMLQGAGMRRTLIKPDANTYNGLRAVGTFNLADYGRRIGGFRIYGPTGTPAKNSKAAFVLDNCPQASVFDIEVGNYDIGFDGINNSFNATFTGIRTDRTGISNTNCAVNIRNGAQSGSDWNFYDCQVSGLKTAVCMAGSGGGYHFLGFSVGTIGTVSDADGLKYGVVTIGWDYAADVEYPGLGSNAFFGGHIEGWRNKYAIRNYGANTWSFQTCGFTASANTALELAKGILKSTSTGNARFNFMNNDVGAGSYAANNIMDLAGEAPAFCLTEENWASNSCTVNAVVTGTDWLRTLGDWSNTTNFAYQRGFYRYVDWADGNHVFGMGRVRIKSNPSDGTWTQSKDNGATWQTLGMPFQASSGASNLNVETWFSPGQVTMTSASANTLTVRADATANCPLGTKITIVQSGTGQTTVVASSTTVNGTPTLKLRTQKSVAFLEKVATNSWILYGDLALT